MDTTADAERIADYAVARRMLEGPDETLFELESDAGQSLFARRPGVLFRHDRERQEIERDGLGRLAAAAWPELPRLVEIVASAGESIAVLQTPGGVTLERLETASDGSRPLLNQIERLHLMEQVLDLAIRLHHDAPGPPEIAYRADFRPAAIHLAGDGQCRCLVTSATAVADLRHSMTRDVDPDFLDFAAPEQYTGDRSPDSRASLFGLGVLAFQLATGRPLFHPGLKNRAETVLRRKIRIQHPLVSDVEPDLAALDQAVLGLLDPDPGIRVDSLPAMREALSTVLGSADRGTIRQALGTKVSALGDDAAAVVAVADTPSTREFVSDID